MARKEKILIEDGVDKREVGYYSTPSFITDYLTSVMLSINPNGKLVLDPAVGKEELIQPFYEKGMLIESFDIIKHTNYKYSNFTQKNFIDFYAEIIANRIFCNCTEYDYIIANPPYNCHEISYIKENKKWLNSIFSVGAYNMYSMFLSAMIDIAKEGCVIGVIISDSFLTSSVHSKLRDQIFSECTIHQLILCPTDLFWSQKADVRTCIMILQKGKSYQGKVKIVNRPSDTEDLKQILINKMFKEVHVDSFRLSKKNNLNQILIDVDDSIINLFHSYPSLGEKFKCVTCISTGNDSKYLSKESRPGYTIPFYKNPASRKFNTSADAYLIDDYMEESLKVKDFMVRNKPFMSKEGIACSSMGLPFSAAYLPIDAVSGVNPTIFPPSEDINWLLSYLNSSLVTYLVRGVLIRSNMVTSGYVNCIPLLNFTEEQKSILSNIADNVRQLKKDVNTAIEEIDNIVFSTNLFSNDVKNNILYFAKNIGRSV
ncbi:MAG: N-6 DNA methylase [Anaerovoracaceae bacterium]